MVRKNIKTFFDIFLQWRYALLVFFVFGGSLFLIIYTPSIQLLSEVVVSGSFSVVEKLKFFLRLFVSAHIEPSFTSIIYFYAVSIISGINVALITYLIKKHFRWKSGAGLTFLGVLGSIFGLGCAACGSLILAGVSYLGGVTPFILALPLQGVELEIAGVALLIVSTLLLLRKIEASLICPS